MTKNPIEWTDEVVHKAFHGTDLPTADRIAAGEKFQLSRGPDHWLGDGVYFFQDSLDRAEYWAKKKAEEKQTLEYGVLRASILLGRCLDLTTDNHRERLAKWIDILKRKVKINRAWIINSFARNGCGGFDTVRCLFPPGLPNEPPSCASRSRKHIQIAVVNIDNISNVVRAKKGKM